MDANQLHEIVIELFGDRNTDDQRPTAALGIIKGQAGVYAAVQGKVIKADQFRDIQRELDVAHDVSLEQVVDAREMTVTVRKRSEWTSYHAEMLVLSAMMNANVWNRDVDTVTANILRNEGAIICANATACRHCGYLMDRLGIEYHGAKGLAGLTGWWNPITDGRYAHGTSEFAKTIPGL
jgi:hypothetical protein